MCKIHLQEADGEQSQLQCSKLLYSGSDQGNYWKLRHSLPGDYKGGV